MTYSETALPRTEDADGGGLAATAQSFEAPGVARRGAGRGWQWAALLPALGLSLATFLVDAPPFPDVPFHIASAEIRTDFHRFPDYPRYYALFDDFGPNSMFHTLAAASGHPRVAMPVIFAFATVGAALMILALARRFRTGPVFPLVGGLFAVNFSATWGFMEFVIGTPLMLAFVWLLAGAPRRGIDGEPPPRRSTVLWAVAIAVLLLVIFFAHAILCIFTLCVLGTFVVLSYPKARSTAVAAALAAVPTVLMIGIWKKGRADKQGGPGWLKHYYLDLFAPDFLERPLVFLTADHGKLLSLWWGFAVATAIVFIACAAITALFIASMRARRATAAVVVSEHALTAARALLLASFAVVLLSPPGYPPFWFVYQRFIFALIIGLALWAAIGAGRHFAPRLLVYVLAAVNLAVGALWFEHVYSYRHVSRDLATLSASVHPAGIGAYVVYDTGWRGEPEALVHTGDLATPFGHLPVQSDLYDYPYARVRRGPGMPTAVPKESSHYVSIGRLLPELDTYGWILVHASADRARITDRDRAKLESRSSEVKRQGDWTIYVLNAPATRPVTETAP